MRDEMNLLVSPTALSAASTALVVKGFIILLFKELIN
jgi:hypothetical protein